MASFALAGCINASAQMWPEAAHIPYPNLGDEWVEQRVTWMYGDDARATVRVAQAPTTVLDQYGYPVEAIVIDSAYSNVQSFSDQHTVEPYSWSAVDVASGTWVVTDVYDVTWNGPDWDRPEYCDFSIGGGENVLYAGEPVAMDFGTLYGQSLAVGDTITQTRAGEITWGPLEGPYRTTVSFTGIEWTDVPVSLGGGPADVAALRVQVDRATWYGTAEADGEPSREVTENWTVATGIPVPLEVVDEDGVVRQSLLSYVRGAEALPIERGPPAAHYDEIHPLGTSASFTLAPDFSKADLDYPLVEALEDMRGTADGVTWFDENPDAYATQGDYIQDSANATYRWEIFFSNGDDLLYATATRQANALGMTRDSASSHVIDGWGGHHAAPADVAGFHYVAADAAMRVGAAFTPDAERPSFGWNVNEVDWGSGSEIVLSYQAYDEEWSGDEYGPVVLNYAEWAGEGVNIDGATGAYSGGMHSGGGSCGAVKLDPPV